MKVGLNVNNTMISIGDSKEDLIDRLTESNIEFEIPFEKVNSQGVTETLLTITGYGIEITFDNGELSYIKSQINEYSIISNECAENCENIEDTVRYIRNIIQKKFKEYHVRFERIDTKSMNITIVLTNNRTEKVRINIIMNRNKQVFINTIRRI